MPCFHNRRADDHPHFSKVHLISLLYMLSIITHAFFILLSPGLRIIGRWDTLLYYCTGAACFWISICLRGLNEIFYDRQERSGGYTFIQCLQYCICCPIAWPMILFVKTLRVVLIPLDALLSLGFCILSRANGSREFDSFVLCSTLITNQTEQAYFNQLSLSGKYYNLIASLVGGGRWIINTLPHIEHDYEKAFGRFIIAEELFQNLGAFLMSASFLMEGTSFPRYFSCRSCDHIIDNIAIASILLSVLSACVETGCYFSYLSNWGEHELSRRSMSATTRTRIDEEWDDEEQESTAFLGEGIEIPERPNTRC